jgi:deoxyribonuclease V
LRAFAKLRSDPDVIFFDGQGFAHPRRLGIASHMGILLDKPAIGCAKSLLVGAHREPGPRRGNRAALRDRGEAIGAVLRTRDHVRPVYVSVGHRVSLDEAIRLTLRCSDGYRIPKPTRLADQYVGMLRRGAAGN